LAAIEVSSIVIFHIYGDYAVFIRQQLVDGLLGSQIQVEIQPLRVATNLCERLDIIVIEVNQNRMLRLQLLIIEHQMIGFLQLWLLLCSPNKIKRKLEVR
jgi:hypothetical protein